MKCIIAGGRDVRNRRVLDDALAACPFAVEITEVVSGACRVDADDPDCDATSADGVDGLGERWARERGIPVRRFYAAFRRDGRSAGPRRNAEMAEYADALLAVTLGAGPGTRSMIREAKLRGLRMFIYLDHSAVVTLKKE